MARGSPVPPGWKGVRSALAELPQPRAFPERISALCQAGKWGSGDGSDPSCEPHTLRAMVWPNPSLLTLPGGPIPAPSDKGQDKRNLSATHPFPPEAAQNVMFPADKISWRVQGLCGAAAPSAEDGIAMHSLPWIAFIPTGMAQTKAGLISRPGSEVCVGSGIPTVPCTWSFSTKEETGLQENAS